MPAPSACWSRWVTPPGDEGQLESEIGENAWLTVEADPEVIFSTPVDERYDRALGLLGLQRWMLSPESGRA